jgi:hypothetical protein
MIGAWFALNVKLLRVHPIELLGDMGQVEARFGLHGDGVNLGVK